jgi:catechol 2,3-dioxygenase-like lactoylglutathione lyase family enzyme
MDAKINHLTIRSEDAYTVGRFYEGFFHMRPAGTKGATEAVSIGDGRIGLNIYPRLSGHPAQLDHFGIEVDDLEAALARMGERYPAIEWLDPAASRPVGSVSAHDPDGNVFSLSQTGATNGEDFYEADGRAQDRVIDHIALRVLHPDRVAEFYAEVFGFSPLANPPRGDNAYLSDGNVTLVIIPWRISDFEGTGISARGLDHIGFRVESIAALKADLDQVSAQNNRFQPSTSVLGRGKEGAGRLTMFRTACPLGAHHLADSDGQLLDVTE